MFMIISRLIELICTFEVFSTREGYSLDDFKEKTVDCVKVSICIAGSTYTMMFHYRRAARSGTRLSMVLLCHQRV